MVRPSVKYSGNRYLAIKRLHRKQEQRIRPFLGWHVVSLAANGTLIDDTTCAKCGTSGISEGIDIPNSLKWVLNRRFGDNINIQMCKACNESAQ